MSKKRPSSLPWTPQHFDGEESTSYITSPASSSPVPPWQTPSPCPSLASLKTPSTLMPSPFSLSTSINSPHSPSPFTLPQTKSLKSYINNDESLHDPYDYLRSITTVVRQARQKSKKDLDQLSTQEHRLFLNSLYDQQKHGLKEFLTVLESSSAFSILYRASEGSDSQDISGERFRELCRQVRESVTYLPYENIDKLSQDIVIAVKKGTDGKFMLWRALELVQENLCHIERDTRTVSRQNSDDPQTRILISTADAFDWPYDGQQALLAFIEYLDVQWVNMWEHYRDSNVKLHRKVATGERVRPKVANGKLIYRLGQKILVPNVTFQACTDTGMSLGFPQRDEAVYQFFNSRVLRVDAEKVEYYEQKRGVSKRSLVDGRPMPWLIQYRIVCLAFLLGLFGQLRETMEKHSVKGPADVANELRPSTASREKFLKSAIERAESFLDNNHSTFENWSSDRLTNSSLASKLSGMGSKDVIDFFTALEKFPSSLAGEMPDHLKPKDQLDKSFGRLKMVLMIDEAKYLTDTRFYAAFRWVIDQVIERAWLLEKSSNQPLPFMVIFLGTNSTMPDFLPPGEDSSNRYFVDYMKVPQPFTALNWDIMVPEEQFPKYKNLTYSSLADMTWLAKFGRPFWLAQWGTCLKMSSMEGWRREADNIITVAEKKLHQMGSRQDFVSKFISYTAKEILPTDEQKREEIILTASAILGVLAIINLDFTSPKRAELLVSSRLRWAVGCDKRRKLLFTTYPSEPILAEAAFRLLFTEAPGTDPEIVLKRILQVMAIEVGRGDVDVGGDGELVARILCLLARRRALAETYENVNIAALVEDGTNADEPQLYSHRPTSVTTFLRCLFREPVIQEIKQRSPEVWKKLETSYINFSHFSEEICHKGAYNSLSTEGLWTHFLRGSAIKCRQGQAGIDMVIPMAVLKTKEDLEKLVSDSDISAIIFQIKNAKKDSGDFTTLNLHKAKFNISHIDGLSESKTRPYIGIWMSLRATNNDIFIEGYEGPICTASTGDCCTNFQGKDELTTARVMNLVPSQREPTPAEFKISSTPSRPTDSASEQSAVPRRSTRSSRIRQLTLAEADSNKHCPQQPKRNDAMIPDTRLVFRARGFEKIYNPSLPLEVLCQFSDRHPYSSSVSGLSFPTELIQQRAMRAVWKLSSSEIVSTMKKQRGYSDRTRSV